MFPSLKYAEVLDAIKRMAVFLGMPDPQKFGTHSFRRGGAYDLSAGGWSEEHVRVMGRWTSDTWARAYAELAFSVVPKTYEPPVLGPLRGGGDCLDHASRAPGGEPMVCVKPSDMVQLAAACGPDLGARPVQLSLSTYHSLFLLVERERHQLPINWSAL